MPDVKYAGVSVRLAGDEYIVPALPLGALRVCLPKLRALGTGDPADQMDDILDVAFAALKRNYPAMTREEVGNLVGLPELAALVTALAEANGLVAKNEESRAEAAPTPTPPSSGDTSTPGSSS